ncbi:MAG: IS21-like element helper ATPase IstB [Candidatus Scatomorpha sp.]|jgi:DNA replication protein DnaC
MLIHETIEKLKRLRLPGFVEALEEQQQISSYQELSFEERLGLLVDRELDKRKSNRIKRLIRQAKFQNSEACIENIDYKPERHLRKQQILELASCQFIDHAKNINILGATGAGKSYLAQALGQAACRLGYSTRYVQLPDMLDELTIAKERGMESFTKLKQYYTKVRLLIIDEWLLFKISEEDCQTLLQIIDRRSSKNSTIVISQFSPDEWISQIPIQVAAEAITDRLTAQAYEIIIHSRESMRKQEQKEEI